MKRLEFDPEQYRKASRHQKEWGYRIIAELPLSGHERVLDLGCGEGLLTAELARRVPGGEVLGIDSSPEMVRAAGALAGPNLSFVTQDINDLAYEDRFDVVFSNATLQWVKDHRRLLGNVLRCLRPGGCLRFNFGGQGNCATLCDVLRETMDRPEFRPALGGFDWPWHFPGTGEYEALVGPFGFVEARVWMENADRFFASADEIVRWIDQPCLVPFAAALDRQSFQSFRDRVVAEMVRRTGQGDGRCFETFRRMNVFAAKRR